MITRAWISEKVFSFRKPAKTSRNTLTDKTSYFICIEDEEGNVGIGECSPIYGLSPEDQFGVETTLSTLIYALNHHKKPSEFDFEHFPSIAFALETAVLDLKNGGKRLVYNNEFSSGQKTININGLIWMSDIQEMMEQIKSKVDKGFSCLKLKIGANDFQEELDLLQKIRTEFGEELELRLDANGAFEEDKALDKLNHIAEWNIHSIEQPIKPGNWSLMAELCAKSPIAIALDEELINIDSDRIPELLEAIKPSYIILKPSLIGGFTKCDLWIEAAQKNGISWWATSMLESNVGLNAIAQWVSEYNPKMFQGLGTGEIYQENIESPLSLEGEVLLYDNEKSWNLKEILDA